MATLHGYTHALCSLMRDSGLSILVRMRLFILALLLAGFTTKAQAQATPPRAPSPPVVELYDLAESLFEAGRLAEAALLLEEALDLESHAILALNLGRVYEAMEQPSDAIRGYELYLELDPAASDAPSVRESIDRLRAEVTVAQPAELALSPPPPEGSRTRVPGAPAVDGPSLAGPVLLLSLAAAGGIVSALVWSSALSERAIYDDPATSRQDALQAQSGAEDLQLATNVIIGVSGAIALAGTLWLIVNLLDPANQESTDRESGESVTAGLDGIQIRF